MTVASRRWLAPASFRQASRLRPRLERWLLQGRDEPLGPYAHRRESAPWWQVLCLTGVDYFSTLGYQPSIAFIAVGVLSPLATLVLVALTLCGALPMYRRIATLSPHGHGSFRLLEELLPRWRGKGLVLALLGFAVTDFVITITLSAADASAHLLENPYLPSAFANRVGLTLALLLVLGAIFLRGVREVVGLAVAIVAAYLAVNAVVLVRCLSELAVQPELLAAWSDAVAVEHGDVVGAVAVSLILFPKLALGLSGFETGVVVMPLVKGAPDDRTERPTGRIRGTHRLLTTAAGIMSVALIASSFATTLLVPAHALRAGGEADGRALAYLAHRYFGDGFGSLYDVCTIAILWFAGASAMAGLLNLVPRYLPRFGMAPEWARATRPLALLFTGVTVLVTLIFDADVNAQGGAYATGVLVLMSSAALGVMLSARAAGSRWWGWALLVVVFAYTTLANIVERPEGIHVASWFIGAIVVTSLMSRAVRSTELRITRVRPDESVLRFVDAVGRAPLRIIAHRPNVGLPEEYRLKAAQAREVHHLPVDASLLFLEVAVDDASDFSDELDVNGVEVGGYRVLRCSSPAVPNAIAALLLFLRDRRGAVPHAYFGWTEGNPIVYLLKYLAFGEGDTAPVTREVLRQAERDASRRPRIHVG